MLSFTCVFNSKQENIIFVFIITIIIIIIIVIIIIITFYLSSSFGTILSVFFLYSVYQKRLRLQMNEALLGGKGGGGMSVPSVNFKTCCLHFEVAVITLFAAAVSTNLHVVCRHFLRLSRPCHLLEFYPIRPSISTQKHDLTVPLLTKAENKNIVLLLPFMSLLNSCKPLTLIQNGKLFDTHVCCHIQ